MPALSVLLFPAIFGLIIYMRWRRLRAMCAQSYEWYRENFPEHMKNGRARCHACKNTRVHTRIVGNGFYMREHFCPNCGKTLYYSAEQGHHL